LTAGGVAGVSADAPTGERGAVASMLAARSVALVGASPRPGSFGARMVAEVARSSAPLALHLVNPRYDEVLGLPCARSLDAVDGPVDLVLLGVPDAALVEELARAARRGDRSAVVFGAAHGLGGALTRIATGAGMALCGGGCMGFVNVTHGLRAIGYVEPDPVPAGPVALVTHSGSVFSALLRTRRRLGFTLAVSSGQELVTAAAAYIEHALDDPGTRVVALVLETLRDVPALRGALTRAAEADVAVVALTVGSSPTGRAMVAAHSGALAGDDAAWEALCDAHGVIRVRDLDELADTLELFAGGRPAADTAGPGGIATVHDSGAERALAADVAHAEGVRYAPIGPDTRRRLASLLDPGLAPDNPLDVWGRGAGTEELFTGALSALADDDAVAAVALAVDLVPELDGDDAYPRAAMAAHAGTTKPVVVLSNIGSAIDATAADTLRRHGVPVLEGTRSGLRALGHLVARRDRAREGVPAPAAAPDPARRARWRARLEGARTEDAPPGATEGLALLADYGIPAVAAHAAGDRRGALAAAEAIGYPVVLKSDEPGVAHKSDVGGVVLGLADAADLSAAYEDLGGRLGPRVTVSAQAAAGVELALGLVRDPLLGPLVVVGAGGVLVELLADRAVGLPPLTDVAARRMLGRLRARPLLDGVRGAPPSDVDAVVAAVLGLSDLALEVGDLLDALDVNPLLCTPDGCVAVDVLVEPARR
jgi:acyl-CoA synthetase (NDP forming)